MLQAEKPRIFSFLSESVLQEAFHLSHLGLVERVEVVEEASHLLLVTHLLLQHARFLLLRPTHLHLEYLDPVEAKVVAEGRLGGEVGRDEAVALAMQGECSECADVVLFLIDQPSCASARSCHSICISSSLAGSAALVVAGSWARDRPSSM